MTHDRESLWAPGKLRSLLDVMQSFEAHRFLALAAVLGEFASRHPANDVVISEDWKAGNLPGLSALVPIMGQVGMDASQVSLERLIALIQRDGIKFTDLSPVSVELKGRLEDQAARRGVFALSTREHELATAPRAGWDTALARFPDIAADVEEAVYCLALSRYPASVYHSVQITELGLIALGKFLKVTDPHSGWTAVASALEKVVSKPHKDRTLFERKNFASLEQIQGTVQALKNAWRNKISHTQGRLVLLGRDFGSERAEEILMATRAFMRRLAEDLPAPKQRKPKLADIPEYDAWGTLAEELHEGDAEGRA